MAELDASGAAALAGWASSGLMMLTGSRKGHPRAGPGDPAGLVDRALDLLAAECETTTGRRPSLPDSRLLGERADLAALRRRAPVSCGGSFRFVRAMDGHVGLSLARPDDVVLVPALVERDVASGEEWSAVQSWAARRGVDEVVDRLRLLGLPGGSIPSSSDPRPAEWSVDDLPTELRRMAPLVLRGGSRGTTERPLVLDFTSLWAGPLCAHLLGLAGARVVKVEAVSRLDGARRGTPAFYDLLHAGHESITVDPRSSRQRDRLREIVSAADLVLEASRPRALRGWGLMAENIVQEGTSWLSITARGRDSDSVGFGDDVAAEGGFVTWAEGAPWPCGDALADPLSGVVAALAAMHALSAPAATLTDVPMLEVSLAAASLSDPCPHQVVEDATGWVVLTDNEGPAAVRWTIQDPQGRRSPRRAVRPGTHNARYGL